MYGARKTREGAGSGGLAESVLNALGPYGRQPARISMMGKLRALRQSITEEVRVYRLVLGHERTPRLARVFLGAALVYAFSPIDLVPDWLPVIGHLDDVVVVPLLIWLALRMLPTDVVTECRAQVRARSDAGDRIARGGI